jgi:subtilisin family serine protease
VTSYPAGYDSVLSVGAIDENKNRASFSQYNNMVDFTAPGVDVMVRNSKMLVG